MIIEYHQNPLLSKITLDENEQRILKLHLKVQMLDDKLFEISYYYNKDENRDKFLRALEYDDDKIETYLEHNFQVSLNSLKYDHGGDCTAFPCSCMKCHTEDVFNMSTIQGLGKHMGSLIFHIYRKDEIKTCEQAIHYLENCENKEQSNYVKTCEWLKNYKRVFLKEN